MVFIFIKRLATQEKQERQSSVFPTWSYTNQPLQSLKQARSLKFRNYEEEKLYCWCCENKDADQLCSYCTADLRLCFRICEKSGFRLH